MRGVGPHALHFCQQNCATAAVALRMFFALPGAVGCCHASPFLLFGRETTETLPLALFLNPFLTHCHSGLVGSLVELVRSATKEKVVRVSLLTLRNLLTSDGSAMPLEFAVVEKGLPKAVNNRLLQVGARVGCA